jgi:hypothetical protein
MVRRAALALLALAATGCASNSAPASQFVAKLVKVSPALAASCRKVARRVGYPVPCPTRLPKEMYTFSFLPVFPRGGAWKRWADASGYGGHGIVAVTEHLAITASPKPTGPAKLVNGPGWLPGERVQLIGQVTVGRQPMQEVYVPPKTNDGSMFMHHIVLVWTQGGHTYGVGFHDTGNRKRIEVLNAAVAASIKLVKPPG